MRKSTHLTLFVDICIVIVIFYFYLSLSAISVSVTDRHKHTHTENGEVSQPSDCANIYFVTVVGFFFSFLFLFMQQFYHHV